MIDCDPSNLGVHEHAVEAGVNVLLLALDLAERGQRAIRLQRAAHAGAARAQAQRKRMRVIEQSTVRLQHGNVRGVRKPRRTRLPGRIQRRDVRHKRDHGRRPVALPLLSH